MEELEGVRKAEPGYFVDVLCGENEKQSVIHVESITESMNQVTVSEGRLPRKAGECFLDVDYMEDYGYQVGDTLEWREDGKELLAGTKYEIVGAGASPLYISFARGNTTLGSGAAGSNSAAICLL